MSMKSEIRAKLAATKALGKVGTAGSLASVKSEKFGTKACWVVELEDVPKEPLRDTGPMLQKEAVIFGIVIGLRVFNDSTGASGEEEMDGMREVVRSNLYDWLPEALKGQYTQRFYLAGANQLKMAEGTLIWVERFKTERYVDAENLL